MWAALAGLAISAIATGIGSAAQKKNQRLAQQAEDNRAKRQEAIMQRSLERGEQDYFSTSSGKHLLTTLNDDYSARLRGLKGGVSKAGSTPESALAHAENLQKGKSRILSSVVAGQDYRRDRAQERYDTAQMIENQNRSNFLQNYYTQSGQAAANAWGNVGKAAMDTGLGLTSANAKKSGLSTTDGRLRKELEKLQDPRGESDYQKPKIVDSLGNEVLLT